MPDSNQHQLDFAIHKQWINFLKQTLIYFNHVCRWSKRQHHGAVSCCRAFERGAAFSQHNCCLQLLLVLPGPPTAPVTSQTASDTPTSPQHPPCPWARTPSLTGTLFLFQLCKEYVSHRVYLMFLLPVCIFFCHLVIKSQSSSLCSKR